ncbi:MAG: ATP-grasp domain-containing protein, partial [Candidatus Levyibacteriota bacterium]
MILLISHKTDPHVDAVVNYLNKFNSTYFRLNTEELPEKVSAHWELTSKNQDGILQVSPSQYLRFSDIRACWYRKPYLAQNKKTDMSDQARQFVSEQSDAFLEDLWVSLADNFWINYPHTIRQSGHKMTNLKIASELGLHTPQTIVTLSPQEASRFYHQCKGNVVTKTLYGTVMNYEEKRYAIYTHKLIPEDLKQIDNVKYAPTLFQEYISKKIEIRVTIVGKKIFACEIHSQDSEKTKIDWRHYDNV